MYFADSGYLAHTKHLLKARNMMTIYKMHEYFVGIFVYKSLNNQLPEIFNNIFTPNMQARNSFNLRPIYCRQKCPNLIFSQNNRYKISGTISQLKLKGQNQFFPLINC